MECGVYKGYSLLGMAHLLKKKNIEKLKKRLKADLAVSGTTGDNIAKLKDMIFNKLRFIRIYTKEARKKADLKEPLIMKSDSTIRDLCMKLHRDFVKKFKYAKIWGTSAKFGGQKFGLDHIVQDGDVIEIHIR